MSSKKVDFKLNIKTPTSSGYTYRSFYTNGTKSTTNTYKPIVSSKSIGNNNSKENVQSINISKLQSVPVSSNSLNYCNHQDTKNNSRLNESKDLYSSRRKKIISYDFNKYDSGYKRDDYITYKNNFFNKYSSKNYVGYVETESVKMKTMYRRDNSHDRIFPTPTTEREITHKKVDVSIFIIFYNLKPNFHKPSSSLQKLNNRQTYLSAENPDNFYSSKFHKAYYGKGLSNKVIGSDDLVRNINKQYIIPKETNENLKILSIFKNDKADGTLRKQKEVNEPASNKSFKALGAVREASNSTSKHKKQSSMRDILNYSSDINFKEDKNLSGKVTNIPFKTVTIQRLKNL